VQIFPEFMPNRLDRTAGCKLPECRAWIVIDLIYRYFFYGRALPITNGNAPSTVCRRLTRR
jgi:hypothetical protein